MFKLGALLCSIIMFSLSGLMRCGEQKMQPYEPNDFDERCRILALQDNEPGQQYAIHREENEVHDVRIHYLGNVKTNGDSTIKFVSQIRYFGIAKNSPRANGSIHLYNEQNCPIGFYNVGGVDDVPKRLAGKSLIFDYTKGDCNQTTAISFADSIPTQMFVNCTNHGGSLWKLERSAAKVANRKVD